MIAPVASPADAATAKLTSIGTINRPLAGIFSTRGTREAFSTPAIADVNGDGRADLIAAGMDGVVEAYSLPGRARIWSVNLGQVSIQSSPAIAELTGDGRNDVVVGTMDGRVVILDGGNGQVVRTFVQGAPLHCAAGVDCRPDGFFATPAIADINSDGILDIVAASWDHTVYAWSSNGHLLWRRFLEDTIWSSPAVADIDRNGTLEIVVGADIYGGNNLGQPAGGLVWILNRDGSTFGGYPKPIPGQTVWSTPALGDVNGDGWIDVVVGTGTNFADPAGHNIHAFTAVNGQSLAGWPVAVDGRAMGSPSLGNLDGDGQLEVVGTSEPGYVYAFDTNGNRMWRGPSSAHGSATIADVDGDGQQEVLAASDHSLRVFTGSSGVIESEMKLTSGGWAPASAPAVAEVDGRTLIVTTKSDTNLTIDIATTGTPMCSGDWPTFKQDARRQGIARSNRAASWAPFGCPAEFMAQQYKDFLNRTLDASGSSYWVSQLRGGKPGATIIQQFMGSPEFGKVVAPVVRAHFALFGTYPATAAAVRSGAASLRAGRSLASVIDTMTSTSAIKALSNEQYVTRIFANVHGRAPSGAELAADVSLLAAGTSRGTVAAKHAEAAAGNLVAQVNVTMTYLGMLDRAPDAAGFNFWVGQARKGSLVNLITGFQGSAEYRNRVT